MVIFHKDDNDDDDYHAGYAGDDDDDDYDNDDDDDDEYDDEEDGDEEDDDWRWWWLRGTPTTSIMTASTKYQQIAGRIQNIHKILGIPWNCSCQRNWHIPSSIFHGTAPVSGIRAFQVPWNPMDFHGTARDGEIGALQVPWSSMKLLVLAKLANPKFHGIPWNCSWRRNWRTPSSMEFHETARVSEIGEPQVPWNSMELLVSAKLAHSKFYGIPWNCSFQRNWRTPNCWQDSKHSQVPWNSMELLVSVKLAHSKFHGIPWNCLW